MDNHLGRNTKSVETAKEVTGKIAIFLLIATAVIGVMSGFNNADKPAGMALMLCSAISVLLGLWIYNRATKYFELRQLRTNALRVAEVTSFLERGGEWKINGGSGTALSFLMLISVVVAWFSIAIEPSIESVAVSFLITVFALPIIALTIQRWRSPLLIVNSQCLIINGYGRLDWWLIDNCRIDKQSSKGGTYWVLVLNVPTLMELQHQMHFTIRLWHNLRLAGGRFSIRLFLLGCSEDIKVIASVFGAQLTKTERDERSMKKTSPNLMMALDRLKNLEKKFVGSSDTTEIAAEVAAIERELKILGERSLSQTRSRQSRSPILLDDLIAKRLPPVQFKAAIAQRISDLRGLENRFWLLLIAGNTAVMGVLITPWCDHLSGSLPVVHRLLSFPVLILSFTRALAASTTVPSAISLSMGVAIWLIPVQVRLIRKHATMLSYSMQGETAWALRIVCGSFLIFPTAFLLLAYFAGADITNWVPNYSTVQLRIVICLASVIGSTLIAALVSVNYSAWIKLPSK